MFDIKYYVTFTDPRTNEKVKIGGYTKEDDAINLRHEVSHYENIPLERINIVERINEEIKFGGL